jgi:hypothetical protein
MLIFCTYIYVFSTGVHITALAGKAIGKVSVAMDVSHTQGAHFKLVGQGQCMEDFSWSKTDTLSMEDMNTGTGSDQSVEMEGNLFSYFCVYQLLLCTKFLNFFEKNCKTFFV